MITDYLGVIAICGEEGTCKTTMALTFPKPLRHYDIDVGGYRRAAWRLTTSDIVSRSYPKPIQIEKLMGTTPGSPTTRAVVPKKVVGMRELWQRIVQDFVTDCQDKTVKTIVIDSATLFWNIAHSSHLQELQEKQLAQHLAKNGARVPFDENDYRERLQPMEYGPANDRMRTVLHTARSFQKNLVLTHYPTDEYGVVPDARGNMVDGRTGRQVIDGFKETSKLADLIVWTSIKDIGVGKDKTKQPIARITKCGLEGLGLSGVGLEIEASYEAIVNLVNMFKPEVANA